MPIAYAHPDTRLDLQTDVEGRIVVEGPGNTVRIGRGVAMTSSLWIQGSGGVIEIGDGCVLNGMMRIVRGEGWRVQIGRGTTFNAVGLSMHEAGEIVIGEDCMFSTDIHLDVSDMHPIYDRGTGARINPARPIRVGDHVWVGTRTLIGKGADIGEGAVIGSGAMVFGQIPPHSLAIGSPARVVRENVTWRRDFDEPVGPLSAETPSFAPRSDPPRSWSRAWVDRLKRLGQKPNP